MKPLENVWSGLTQRRLLPVAILLLAGLVAVPLLLAKDPAPIPAESTAPVAGANAATAEADALDDPVVSLVTDGERTQRRRVLGVRKNPFQPAKAPKVKDSKVSAADETAGPSAPATGGAEKTEASGGPAAPGSSPGTSPAAPVAPAAPEAQAPAKQYELYSLTVRFGASDADTLEKMNLPRLKALPSAKDPLLVYLGPGKDGKSAVFMVDASLEPQGDGTCEPSPASCETIRLRVGETEFFDVLDENGETTAQYQLDLVKIKTSKTDDVTKVGAARAKESKAGRRVLRARQAAKPLRYRYDAKSGTVRKIPARAYKALRAKSARAALSTAGGF